VLLARIARALFVRAARFFGAAVFLRSPFFIQPALFVRPALFLGASLLIEPPSFLGSLPRLFTFALDGCVLLCQLVDGSRYERVFWGESS